MVLSTQRIRRDMRIRRTLAGGNACRDVWGSRRACAAAARHRMPFAGRESEVLAEARMRIRRHTDLAESFKQSMRVFRLAYAIRAVGKRGRDVLARHNPRVSG